MEYSLSPRGNFCPLCSFVLRVLCVLLLSAGGLLGQPRYSSYTLYGMGNPNERLLVQQVGSNIGIASFSHQYLNLVNAAWLARHEYTHFHFSAAAEDRVITHDRKEYSAQRGDIGYVALGIPVVKKRWYVAFSLFPYAEVDYRFSFEEPLSTAGVPTGVQDARVRHNLNGQGGVDQLSFLNGLKITERWHIGVGARYLHGLVRREEQIALVNTLSPGHYANHLSEQAYQGFLWEGSLGYAVPAGRGAEVLAGLVYRHAARFRVREGVLLEHRSRSGFILQNDQSSREKITYLRRDLPSEWGMGCSYRRGEDLLVGMGGSWRQWWWGNTAQGGGGYEASFSVRMGVQWVPDAAHLTRYLLRMPYRLGVGMNTLPRVQGGGRLVADYYASAGLSFPLRRVGFIDVGLRYGHTGGAADFLQERYVQYHVGTTLQSRWFLREWFD